MCLCFYAIITLFSTSLHTFKTHSYTIHNPHAYTHTSKSMNSCHFNTNTTTTTTTTTTHPLTHSLTHSQQIKSTNIPKLQRGTTIYILNSLKWRLSLGYTGRWSKWRKEYIESPGKRRIEWPWRPISWLWEERRGGGEGRVKGVSNNRLPWYFLTPSSPSPL